MSPESFAFHAISKLVMLSLNSLSSFSKVSPKALAPGLPPRTNVFRFAKIDLCFLIDSAKKVSSSSSIPHAPTSRYSHRLLKEVVSAAPMSSKSFEIFSFDFSKFTFSKHESLLIFVFPNSKRFKIVTSLRLLPLTSISSMF